MNVLNNVRSIVMGGPFAVKHNLQKELSSYNGSSIDRTSFTKTKVKKALKELEALVTKHEFKGHFLEIMEIVRITKSCGGNSLFSDDGSFKAEVAKRNSRISLVTSRNAKGDIIKHYTFAKGDHSLNIVFVSEIADVSYHFDIIILTLSFLMLSLLSYL